MFPLQILGSFSEFLLLAETTGSTAAMFRTNYF